MQFKIIHIYYYIKLYQFILSVQCFLWTCSPDVLFHCLDNDWSLSIPRHHVAGSSQLGRWGPVLDNIPRQLPLPDADEGDTRKEDFILSLSLCTSGTGRVPFPLARMSLQSAVVELYEFMNLIEIGVSVHDVENWV